MGRGRGRCVAVVIALKTSLRLSCALHCFHVCDSEHRNDCTLSCLFKELKILVDIVFIL